VKKSRVILRHVLRRYAAIGRGLGSFLLLLASCGVASFLVVYPLWFFATNGPRLFTGAVLGVGVVVVAVLIAMRVRRRIAEEPGYIAAVLVPGAARIALVLAAIGVVYLTAWLFAAGLYVAAVPTAIIVVAAFGLVSPRR
jgi:hypothetical protein